MYTLNRPQSREIFIIRCWEEAMGYNNFSLTVGQAIFSSMNRFYGKFKKGRVGFIDKTMWWMKTEVFVYRSTNQSTLDEAKSDKETKD